MRDIGEFDEFETKLRLKSLSIEARHTISREIAKKRRLKFENSCFLPRNYLKNITPFRMAKNENESQKSKKVSCKRSSKITNGLFGRRSIQFPYRRTLQHPECFPLSKKSTASRVESFRKSVLANERNDCLTLKKDCLPITSLNCNKSNESIKDISSTKVRGPDKLNSIDETFSTQNLSNSNAVKMQSISISETGIPNFIFCSVENDNDVGIHESDMKRSLAADDTGCGSLESESKCAGTHIEGIQENGEVIGNGIEKDMSTSTNIVQDKEMEWPKVQKFTQKIDSKPFHASIIKDENNHSFIKSKNNKCNIESNNSNKNNDNNNSNYINNNDNSINNDRDGQYDQSTTEHNNQFDCLNQSVQSFNNTNQISSHEITEAINQSINNGYQVYENTEAVHRTSNLCFYYPRFGQSPQNVIPYHIQKNGIQIQNRSNYMFPYWICCSDGCAYYGCPCIRSSSRCSQSEQQPEDQRTLEQFENTRSSPQEDTFSRWSPASLHHQQKLAAIYACGDDLSASYQVPESRTGNLTDQALLQQHLPIHILENQRIPSRSLQQQTASLQPPFLSSSLASLSPPSLTPSSLLQCLLKVPSASTTALSTVSSSDSQNLQSRLSNYKKSNTRHAACMGPAIQETKSSRSTISRTTNSSFHSLNDMRNAPYSNNISRLSHLKFSINERNFANRDSIVHQQEQHHLQQLKPVQHKLYRQRLEQIHIEWQQQQQKQIQQRQMQQQQMQYQQMQQQLLQQQQMRQQQIQQQQIQQQQMLSQQLQHQMQPYQQIRQQQIQSQQLQDQLTQELPIRMWSNCNPFNCYTPGPYCGNNMCQQRRYPHDFLSCYSGYPCI